MDDRRDIIGWTVDGIASALLGGAAGWSLLLVGQPQAAVVASAALCLLALAALRQVKPGAQSFRLPAFSTEAAYAFDIVSDSAPAPEPVPQPEEEPLLLEDRLDEPAPDARIVQLFAPRSFPTPGELQRRIEAHLAAPARPAEDGKVLELEVDAAAALRQALGELRRNSG